MNHLLLSCFFKYYFITDFITMLLIIIKCLVYIDNLRFISAKNRYFVNIASIHNQLTILLKRDKL